MVKLVINNKLYDLTNYLEEHPGGEDILINLEDKDATNDFYDIGHSAEAIELLKKYNIKDIKKNIIEETYIKKNTFNCIKKISKVIYLCINFITTQYSDRMSISKNKKDE